MHTLFQSIYQGFWEESGSTAINTWLQEWELWDVNGMHMLLKLKRLSARKERKIWGHTVYLHSCAAKRGPIGGCAPWRESQTPFCIFLGGSSSLYWGNHLGNRYTRSELALLMCRRCSSMWETALTTHLELDFELGAHSGEVAQHASGVATHVTLPPNQSIPSIHWPHALANCSDRPET